MGSDGKDEPSSKGSVSTDTTTPMSSVSDDVEPIQSKEKDPVPTKDASPKEKKGKDKERAKKNVEPVLDEGEPEQKKRKNDPKGSSNPHVAALEAGEASFKGIAEAMATPSYKFAGKKLIALFKEFIEEKEKTEKELKAEATAIDEDLEYRASHAMPNEETGDIELANWRPTGSNNNETEKTENEAEKEDLSTDYHDDDDDELVSVKMDPLESSSPFASESASKSEGSVENKNKSEPIDGGKTTDVTKNVEDIDPLGGMTVK